jgi:ATP-dependent DNA ligase
MLAPTWVPHPEQIAWPVLASEKIQGIRALIFPSSGTVGPWGGLRSRSGCVFGNEAMAAMLAPAQAVADTWRVVFDGELFIPGLVETELQAVLRERDAAIDGLGYHVFDAIDRAEFEGESVDTFARRIERAGRLLAGVPGVEVLPHRLISGWGELTAAYRTIRQAGGEGLMLRNPAGPYRHGRCTMGEKNIWKIKPIHRNSKQREIPCGLEV